MTSSFFRKCENLFVIQSRDRIVIPQKKDFDVESKLYIKRSDIENLNFLFFYFMDYHFTF